MKNSKIYFYALFGLFLSIVGCSNNNFDSGALPNKDYALGKSKCSWVPRYLTECVKPKCNSLKYSENDFKQCRKICIENYKKIDPCMRKNKN